MNEAAFATQVESLFDLHGWWWCHRLPARTGRTYIGKDGEEKEVWNTPFSGKPGLLDYFAVRPPRVLLLEIKGDGGKVTPEEQELLTLLWQCQKAGLGIEVGLWWPDSPGLEAMVEVLR